MSSNHSYLELSLDSFGPSIPGGFDFTLNFEATILSILPSTLLLFALPCRIIALRGKPRKVSGSFLYENKLLFMVAFTCLQVVLLVLFATNKVLRTGASISAAILALLDAVGLCLLSHVEHIYSVRPSAIINAYLLLTLPFDIARSRTLWLLGATKTVAAVFTGAVAVKSIILIAEAIEKRHILLDRYRHLTPEATSGIYSRSFFSWLNHLMQVGYDRILKDEDLYPIGDDMASEYLYKRAHRAWSICDKNRPRALLWSTLRATRNDFAFCIFPRLCLIGFRYAQPFLLARTVKFANSPHDSDAIGWGLTAAFGLVFLGMAVSSGSYYHMIYRFRTTVRGSLVSQIYAKTMHISITALDESAAVTLMSNDTDAICDAFTYIHEVWAVPIELGIALYLLNRELGLAFLAPAAVAILSTAGIFIMSKYMGIAQKTWIEGIQTRVDVTASMLSSMKPAKMLGFTDVLTSVVQKLRVTELKLSNLFRRLLCLRVLLGNSTDTISPLVTFIVFVINANTSGRTLNTASAYTALSLISLLGSPMNVLVATIPLLNAALACFTRIESYLKSDARRDHRLPLATLTASTIAATTPSVATGIEMNTLHSPLLNPESMLTARDASFSWKLEGIAPVREVSFNLQRCQICFVIGPVGSGKSTLLKGLLGETPSSQGFVYSNSPDTAFVDQTSWIRNATIQQNIIGVSTYEASWYRQVVHACGIESDIAMLTKGHSTQVGSAGISLSGGQKQRVALARAVYARKDFIIIDDVFSGLDAESEEHICNSLLGNTGLFRRMGTTVLLATHAIQRLGYADHIIALDSTGRIAEQGSFEYLQNRAGYVQSLTAKLKSEGSTDNSKIKVPDSDNTMPSTVQEVDLIDIAPSFDRQNGDIAVYKHYFASVGWSTSALFFGFCVLYGVATKMTELLVTYWTKAVDARGNDANPFYLGIYGLLAGLGLLGLMGGIFELAMRMVPQSAQVLHDRLLKTVMAAPLAFFTSTDTGEITNRFSQDMTVIDTELPYSLVDLSLSIVVSLMGAILMCLSAGYFAALIPVVILVVWVLQKYYLRTSRQMRLLDLEAKSPLYSHFIESLSGLVTIRSFGWGERFKEKNLELLDTSQKPYYLLFCIQRWLALILDLIVTVLAVILMILVVKLRKDISPGFVGLALLNVMSFNQSLASIIQNWTRLETSLGAISRLMHFSSSTISENGQFENGMVPENWPLHGNIELRNVSASYAAGGHLVIKNLTMSIEGGQRIGLCGRSGSGKSSLITALFRMLEVTDGSSITIDGIDITRLPRDLIRQRLNAIPQEPFFVRGTVRANADPYQQHRDEEIIEAIEKVQLWELVHSKGGLDIDMDSDLFSHGQRQLFCLARAILRKSKIVILDEATSSVDTKSDELMQRVIREEFSKCTIIAVAHRLDTIMDYDKIALLSGGKLVEFDKPAALLSRRSLFRDLYYS